MWHYDQSSGELSHNGKLIARGYAGAGDGKNNPAKEGVVRVGPLPAGKWRIGAPVHRPKTIGQFCLPLTPVGHSALGRSAFYMHGDSAKNPGKASLGCIVMPRWVREQVWASGDRELTVVH